MSLGWFQPPFKNACLKKLAIINSFFDLRDVTLLPPKIISSRTWEQSLCNENIQRKTLLSCYPVPKRTRATLRWASSSLHHYTSWHKYMINLFSSGWVPISKPRWPSHMDQLFHPLTPFSTLSHLKSLLPSVLAEFISGYTGFSLLLQ